MPRATPGLALALLTEAQVQRAPWPLTRFIELSSIPLTVYDAAEYAAEAAAKASPAPNPAPSS